MDKRRMREREVERWRRVVARRRLKLEAARQLGDVAEIARRERRVERGEISLRDAEDRLLRA
jgi:hypothetical protein